MFKGDAPRYILLSTAVNGALCGVNLAVDSTYLFNFGSTSSSDDFPADVYNIGLCGSPILWGSLSKEQKKFVRTNADGGEGCKGLEDVFIS